jgi:hypothetical protein
MRKWLPVMIGSGVLLGASAFWYHSRAYAPSQLVQMLPPDRAVYVYLNVELLRKAALLDVLAGSTSLEQGDYKQFVRDSGFDYRRDLDGVAIAFRDGDVYYAAQGRFDWPKLEAFAGSHGGKCERFLCKMPGTVPGRDVSYYMPRNNILAIATSSHATAGDMVAPGTWSNGPKIPDVGLWVAAPGAAFRDLTAMPSLLRPLLSPLTDARSAIFTLGAGRQDFELHLEVNAKDAASATKLATQFGDITRLAIQAMEREKVTPSPTDLSGVLAAGVFQSSDTTATGTWPISRTFLSSLSAPVK